MEHLQILISKNKMASSDKLFNVIMSILQTNFSQTRASVNLSLHAGILSLYCHDLNMDFQSFDNDFKQLSAKVFMQDYHMTSRLRVK